MFWTKTSCQPRGWRRHHCQWLAEALSRRSTSILAVAILTGQERCVDRAATETFCVPAAVLGDQTAAERTAEVLTQSFGPAATSASARNAAL